MMEDDDALNISLQTLDSLSDQVFANEAEQIGVTLIAVKMLQYQIERKSYEFEITKLLSLRIFY